MQTNTFSGFNHSFNQSNLNSHITHTTNPHQKRLWAIQFIRCWLQVGYKMSILHFSVCFNVQSNQHNYETDRKRVSGELVAFLQQQKINPCIKYRIITRFGNFYLSVISLFYWFNERNINWLMQSDEKLFTFTYEIGFFRLRPTPIHIIHRNPS